MVFEIVKLLLAALFGFLVNFALQRQIHRKVKLQHEIGESTIFEDIPPAIAFQDIRIKNFGNSSANNIKVRFKKEALEQNDVSFRVRNDEIYEDDAIGSTRVLTFNPNYS